VLQEFLLLLLLAMELRVAEGKVREFNGKMHVMELAFKADFAIVKAWKGDTAGNLIFKELQETLIRACQEPLRSPLLKWRN
jgi:acyl CoA:acetate/3-ketoacid CoA transferase alpha subunit